MALWETGRGTGDYTPSGTPPKESTITSSIIRSLKEYMKNGLNVKTPFVRKVHGGGFSRAGMPDIYVQYNGAAIWIEVKRPGADTTALQKDTLEMLAENGAYVGVAHSADEAVKLLKEVHILLATRNKTLR